MNLVEPVINAIIWLLAIGGVVLGVFAAGDASTRRPDAFAAADKQTKGTWSGITVACAIVSLLGLAFPFGAFGPPTGLLWLAALVGELVYVLDVRPKLREVQRGSRW
ncbi:Protein of unknown function [Nakamurella panacisegetis]|uniref:DUF2516 family protein n=1 Tax=Nakamurella panacisegetis TaxID=1090615 RepID=A0A1H0NN23_9ACTN|nr:DUF2516 family protein [Nakamurella panacisegetis]SDO94041.1 Protein of unknown function [Nakamurella panacisegetis]